MSDRVRSGSDSGMTPPPTKKAARRQPFCLSWLEEPEFSPWLARCEDNEYKAKCLACNKTLRAGKNDLRKHSGTQKHLTRLLNTKIETLEEKCSSSSLLSYAERVKREEIVSVLDIVEHRRSFYSFNHSAEMTNRAECDSNIIKNKKLKRTKIVAILKNVLNKAVVDKVTTILRSIPFSILVDESTDMSGNKNLCILARYMYEGKIQTYLLDYFQLKDGKAEYLYTCFQQIMERYKLPTSNIIGICIDNANVMLDKRNSFVSGLIEDNKNEVAIFPCICNSMNLVASYACECLPKHVAKLLHMLYNYFANSNKKQQGLEELQEIMNMTRQKMREPAKPKWLTLAQSVESVVKQWDTLYEFFAAEISKDVTLCGVHNSVTAIFNHLNCLYTKAYLNFLNYILKLIHQFNTLFQTDEVLIHCFMAECDRFLRVIAFNFMHPQIVDRDDLHLIDPCNVGNLLPIQSITIGHEAKNIIQELRTSGDDDKEIRITEFYQNCQQFYQELFKGVIQRLPYTESFMRKLSFLIPEKALSLNKCDDDIEIIAKKFKSKVNVGDTMTEWRIMTFHFDKELREEMKKLNVCEFWERIKEVEDYAGKQKFNNMYTLAQICLSLPHSNAEIERLFSLVNEVKTKDRNGLKPETVAALTRVRLDLRNTNTTCTNYPITREMLQFDSSIYERNSFSQEISKVIIQDETKNSD
ncbi:uncharacterized protein LOC108628855 [Ceratina calcarata]|uniref:Uncharacterized protein LOC108628855 n=1 Tax=Ceratina calcarata TaxID=156304 RepID=A0AAJ7J797_9HYME|nr:uncharacterized protein LOC108628855 [Ceratina calcarata]